MRASTFYSDYFYQSRSSSRYVYRGGDSSGGSYCGAFFVLAGSAASATLWNRGAALSFKPVDSCSRRFIVILFIKIELVRIMLVAVVIRARVLTAVLSMLLLTMLPLLRPGIVALLYHLNYRIGTFLASVTGSAGSGSTFYSDYFSPVRSDIRYASRGGSSSSGAYCGSFCVTAGRVAYISAWDRGAALSFKPAA